MATKERTLRIQSTELPAEWAEQTGIEIKAGEFVTITITPSTKPRKKSAEKLHELVERFQRHPVIDPNFSEADLYDEQGLPK